MVRSLKVGQSVQASIQNAMQVVDNPLKKNFQSFGNLVSVGIPVPTALRAVGKEIDIAEFDFFVFAVTAHLESGGNLATILQSLADTIRDRTHLRLKIAALAAEGKMSAILLSILPIALFGYINLVQPGYAEPFYTREVGELMLFIAFGLIAVGYYVMQKIANLKV